jgi:hypothetical protein
MLPAAICDRGKDFQAELFSINFSMGRSLAYTSLANLTFLLKVLFSKILQGKALHLRTNTTFGTKKKTWNQ